jgi:hypothetical protein
MINSRRTQGGLASLLAAWKFPLPDHRLAVAPAAAAREALLASVVGGEANSREEDSVFAFESESEGKGIFRVSVRQLPA